MNFLRVSLISCFCFVFAGTTLAEDLAVFPMQSVNTDKSFADAFGMLLAKKYEKVSGQSVLSSLKSGKALEKDSNMAAAAARLGVSEYLEIEGVGLYLSRREKQSVTTDSVDGTKIYVNVNSNNASSEGEQGDQNLLDNSKTIVTVTRRTQAGAQIYKVEMTLLTYGDIEESCDRIAQSLYKRIPLENSRNMTNITRREGMGNNRLFVETHKGIKVTALYPLGYRGEKFSSIVGIGYDMRFDAEKYFMELCVGARIPTAMYSNTTYTYGGVALDMGANYFLLPGSIGLYAGGGLSPFLNFANNSQFGLAPFVKLGVAMPRESKMQFYIDLRIAQNLMPIHSEYTDYSVGGTSSVDQYGYYVYTPSPNYSTTSRPFEIGMDFGMQW